MPTAEMTSRRSEDDAGANLGTVGEMIADGDTAATTRAGADNREVAMTPAETVRKATTTRRKAGKLRVEIARTTLMSVGFLV